MKTTIKRKTLGILTVIIAAAIALMIIPDRIALADSKDMVTYLYKSGEGTKITLKDSKGNEIKEGERIKVGTELTVYVYPLEGYEVNPGDYVQICYEYDHYYIYLNDDCSTTFTVLNEDFYIYNYGRQWFDVSISGDKNLKSITITSIDGEISNTYPGNKIQLKLNKATGLIDNAVNIKYEFNDGYVLKETNATLDDISWINSDGSYRYRFWNEYDYENDKYSNEIKIDISSKKEKKTETKSNLGKLKTAKATYKKGTVSIKGKKVLAKFSIDSWIWDDGSLYENLYPTTEFNVSAAKDIELIDLSKCTKISQGCTDNLVYWLYREYKKGNLPKLKAICLPKNRVLETINYSDGYMEYYPLTIYNAE